MSVLREETEFFFLSFSNFFVWVWVFCVCTVFGFVFCWFFVLGCFLGLFGCGVKGFGCTSALFWLVVGVGYVVFGVFCFCPESAMNFLVVLVPCLRSCHACGSNADISLPNRKTLFEA